MKYHDLSNQRFGRLIALFPGSHPASVRARDKYWVCICDCGNRTFVAAKSLKNGHTSSCGCLQKERAAQACKQSHTSHGHTRGNKTTKEYRAWTGVITRCENHNIPSFSYYGGRGIVVHPPWRESFESFLADVGPAPSSSHSLDRVDVEGGYVPGNVRWATQQEQSRNRRDRKQITYKGKTQFLSDWSKDLSIHLGTLHSRLYKYGWTVDRAFTVNPKDYHHKE